MANMPSSTGRAAARAPSPSTSSSSHRFSSKGRFLKRFLRRLIPPFSPSSTSSSHPSPSEGTSTTDTATTKSNKAGEDNQGAEAPTDGKMAYDPTSAGTDKENADPASTAGLNGATAGLTLEKRRSPEKPALPPGLKLTADGLKPSAPKPQSIHQEFMDQALDMARLALRTNETPVGCVLVHKDKVVAKGMNATNVTRNGTRHAEFMAVSALLSYRPKGARSDDSIAEPRHIPSVVLSAEAAAEREREKDAELGPNPSLKDSEYVKSGHLYPYGQKIHTDERVPRSIVSECVLYVTVEPCVMCAGLLRQLGIRKVYFGAVNDKFGGAGGVFSIHLNSIRPQDLAKRAAEEEATKTKDTKMPLGVLTNGQTVSRSNSLQGQDKIPQKMSSGQYHQPLSNPDGDGGNVERGFEIEGGWGRDEAIGLLRRFYVQENGRAPQPRKKEGRAARLAAIEQGVELPAAELQTGATPAETAADNTAAEATKTALDAEIAEIPLQEPVLKGNREPVDSN